MALECGAIPLYRMVSKFSPTKFGSKNVLVELSHVPSPTVMVSELYELLPAGASCGDGDMLYMDFGDSAISYFEDTLMRQLRRTPIYCCILSKA